MVDFALYLLPVIVAELLRRWRHGALVMSIAKQILGSKDNNVTRITEAVSEAVVQRDHADVVAAVKKLEKLQAAGKLEIAAAEERGRANAELVTTEIVPRDGTEVFK